MTRKRGSMARTLGVILSLLVTITCLFPVRRVEARPGDGWRLIPPVRQTPRPSGTPTPAGTPLLPTPAPQAPSTPTPLPSATPTPRQTPAGTPRCYVTPQANGWYPPGQGQHCFPQLCRVCQDPLFTGQGWSITELSAQFGCGAVRGRLNSDGSAAFFDSAGSARKPGLVDSNPG
jgi:hypothetical protein